MGVSGAAGALLAAELCAPLLLLCGLCCWPDDASDTSSSPGKGQHPQKPIVARESGRPRSSAQAPRRTACSAASLHLPSTSGDSHQQLPSHRSHEELPRPPAAGGAGGAGGEGEWRYHSAPSVIDEVLHRRDWERSAKELYIPLRPENALSEPDSEASSPSAPRASPDTSSAEGAAPPGPPAPPAPRRARCKKHHTNIKSSRNRTQKESNQSDVKDTDATEDSESHFYIGETRIEDTEPSPTNEPDATKSVYKAKDAKQSLNESIKTKTVPDFVFRTIEDQEPQSLEMYHVKMMDIDMDLYVDELDRDGAMHHSGSASSVATGAGAFPRSSVEAVGYEGGACYLAESGTLSRPALPGPVPRPVPGPAGGGGRVAELTGAGRARHASDGDILAPTLRPESGAFSESDLELELELVGSEERPPPYHELPPRAPPRTPPRAPPRAPPRRETAI